MQENGDESSTSNPPTFTRTPSLVPRESPRALRARPHSFAAPQMRALTVHTSENRLGRSSAGY